MLNAFFRFVLLTLSLFAVEASANPSRPNIIVFYTDDHGHADLSCQGILDDIKTPNVDALAKNGVLARHGYSTAPQCVPSRAGLMVGKFQSRFGVDSNSDALDGFDAELTIAQRLQTSGYVTAQFGKWHLGATNDIPVHGFKHAFAQNSGAPFHANLTLHGDDREMSVLQPEMYHIDACSQAAASVIQRYKDSPFFLYIAYRAPHVPLDAPQKYLDRFPGEMPQRRRQALAMLSAVDDGVGLVTKTLADLNLTKKTLIFYIGDNGAPLKIHKADMPGGGPGWDGSLNDPLNGEKGMLAEGGMHVPFVVAWPGTIPGGQVYQHPISALDVAATAAALANIETDNGDLDGVNLVPYLTGEIDAAPHDALMWRWISQTAIREGNWKLLRGGDREYLYDLGSDLEEKHNLASIHPEIANRLRARLSTWANTLSPPGLAIGPMAATWHDYFDFYLDGKPAAPLREKFDSSASAKDTTASDSLRGWIARNGELTTKDGALLISGAKKSKHPFLVRSGLKIAGPITALLQVKSTDAGSGTIAWREQEDKDFLPENRVPFQLSSTNEWKDVTIQLPVDHELIHLRILLPSDEIEIRKIELKSDSGKSLQLW